MKKENNSRFLFSLLLSTTLAAMLFAVASCKDDPPPPSAQDQTKAKMMANNWKVQNVTVDGVDQGTVYKDLTIKFTESGFTTTNGGAVWPASGTWSFTSADATTIKRNDGLEVKVAATSSSLKLTLTWTKTTLSVGRTESMKGQNVFTFGK